MRTCLPKPVEKRSVLDRYPYTILALVQSLAILLVVLWLSR